MANDFNYLYISKFIETLNIYEEGVKLSEKCYMK